MNIAFKWIMLTHSANDSSIAQLPSRKPGLPIALTLGLVLLMGLLRSGYHRWQHYQDPSSPSAIAHLPELAMTEGDPHIRALMLTISVSESNHRNAYFLLYGGGHVHDLTQHPNQCQPITVGPNQGQCSTAAGRYQFLTATWREKAAKYHPAPEATHHGTRYSFAPEYQDEVVYRWLKDHHQWDADLLALLREDRIEEVLSHLSPIWTSLGDGIEDNSMTPYLPGIYRELLAKELNRTDG